MWNRKDALAHHGIKGQKWGVRRFQNPDGSWTAAGRERYGKGGDPRSSLAGASVGSGGESSSSGERPSKSGTSLQKDPETGFHKIVKNESDADRLARCNPNYFETTNISPYNRNCGNTVIADALRRRGLDVEARGNNLGMTTAQMGLFFDNMERKEVTKVNAPKMASSTKNALMFGGSGRNVEKAKKSAALRGEYVKNEVSKQIASAYPDGASGAMVFTSIGGGHWISFEVKDGKTTFSNPQDPNLDMNFMFGCYEDYGRQNPITALRLDNAKINKNTIGNVVMNYGDKKDSTGMDWDPLVSEGAGKVSQLMKNPRYAKALHDSLGNKWDGKWEEYSPAYRAYLMKEEFR